MVKKYIVEIIKLPFEFSAIQEDGTVRLHEERIFKKDNFEIYVRGEKSKHNRPHAHVYLSNGNEYTLCIDDTLDVLSNNEDRYIRLIKKKYINDNIIQKCRKYWEEKVPNKNYHFRFDPKNW